MMRFLVVFLMACGGTSDPAEPPAPFTTDTGPTTYTTPIDCVNDVPQLPLQVTERIGGFTGAEDFAFDDQGNYVATDSYGNLVRISKLGVWDIWVPGFGDTAGTAFLPDGKLAIANVTDGQVDRVRKSGAIQTVIAGMSYPNGLTVDFDGVIYVADQNFGAVYRFDPATGVQETIAEGLYNPNGLALSPDHSILYVGSFGGGTVHSIDLVNGGGAVLFGSTPNPDATTPTASCNEGEECFLDYIGIGECDPAGTCELSLDTEACQGLSEGSPCVTDTLGEINYSLCVPHPDDGALFCPEVPGDVVTPCQNANEGDPCTARGISRDCQENWEGILVCDITPWREASEEACQGLAVDDYCIVIDYEGYASGTCAEDPYFGANYCDVGFGGGGYSFHGGLDGVQVDACGYVWVTEYTLGYVWRFPPTGGDPELAVETGTFWIPNMHWGNGIGGWEEDVMYMQDRFSDELLVIPVGIPGAPVALEL